MSEQFTCTKCRRTGTRQFETTGDGWTCTAKWACQSDRDIGRRRK